MKEFMFQTKKGKRICALIMAILLILVQFPVQNLLMVKADGPVTKNVELSVTDTEAPTEGSVSAQMYRADGTKAGESVTTSTYSATANKATFKFELTYDATLNIPTYIIFTYDSKDYYVPVDFRVEFPTCDLDLTGGSAYQQLTIATYSNGVVKQEDNVIDLSGKTVYFASAIAGLKFTAASGYYISAYNDGTEHETTAGDVTLALDKTYTFTTTAYSITVSDVEGTTVKYYKSAMFTEEVTDLTAYEIGTELYVKITPVEGRRFKESDGVTATAFTLDTAGLGYNDGRTEYKAKINGFQGYGEITISTEAFYKMTVQITGTENGTVTGSEGQLSDGGSITYLKDASPAPELTITPNQYYKVKSVVLNEGGDDININLSTLPTEYRLVKKAPITSGADSYLYTADTSKSQTLSVEFVSDSMTYSAQLSNISDSASITDAIAVPTVNLGADAQVVASFTLNKAQYNLEDIKMIEGNTNVETVLTTNTGNNTYFLYTEANGKVEIYAKVTDHTQKRIEITTSKIIVNDVKTLGVGAGETNSAYITTPVNSDYQATGLYVYKQNSNPQITKESALTSLWKSQNKSFQDKESLTGSFSTAWSGYIGIEYYQRFPFKTFINGFTYDSTTEQKPITVVFDTQMPEYTNVNAKDKTEEALMKLSDSNNVYKYIAKTQGIDSPSDKISFQVTDPTESVTDVTGAVKQYNSGIDKVVVSITPAASDTKTDIDSLTGITTVRNDSVYSFVSDRTASNYYVYIIDKAENISKFEVQFIYDNQAPVLTSAKVELSLDGDEINGFMKADPEGYFNVYNHGSYFKNTSDHHMVVSMAMKDYAGVTGNTTLDGSGIETVQLFQESTANSDTMDESKPLSELIDNCSSFRDNSDVYHFKAMVLDDITAYNGKIWIKAVDKLGNSRDIKLSDANSILSSDTIQIENDKPIISDVSVTAKEHVVNAGKSYSGDVVVKFKATDTGSGLNAVYVSVNNEVIKTIDYSTETVKKDEAIEYTLDTSTLTNKSGSYVFGVKAIDNAGNIQENTDILGGAIGIDTQEPKIVSMVAADTGVELKTSEEMTEYGYFFTKATTVKVTAADLSTAASAASGVKTITAYAKDYSNGKIYAVLSNGALKEINENQINTIAPVNVDTSSAITFTVPEGFKGQIYAKTTDKVERESAYFSASGTIVESQAMHDGSEHVVLGTTNSSKKDIDGRNLFDSNVTVPVNIMDSTSGINKIEWKIESPYDTGNNQSGVININASGAMSGDTSGWTLDSKDKNLATKVSGSLTVRNNSNDITLSVKMTDNAGNITTRSRNFSIDKTTPSISIVWGEETSDTSNISYFRTNRTATVTVTERNFNAADIQTALTNDLNGVPSFSSWSAVNTSGTDQTEHVATMTFSEDGEYNFNVSYTDLAGNGTASFENQNFIIDKTNPTISVAYDNNAAANGNYYKEARTATITILEHNFDSSRVTINGTGDNFPAVSSWSNDGDSHTATLSYNTDREYTFSMAYVDMAGNSADAIAEESFIIDLSVPTGSDGSSDGYIGGVENAHAYGNGSTVAPSITVNDKYLDTDAFSWTMTKDGTTITDFSNYGYHSSIEGTDISIAFDNFANEEALDGIYVFTVNGQDKAGNTFTDSRTFSVNRFGSTYSIPMELKSIIGTYTNSPIDVVISEINVNELLMEDISVVLTKNGASTTLTRDTDYSIARGEVAADQWSVYTYTINKSVFNTDGSYIITLYSKDAANNDNQNILESKKAEVYFGVDMTSPAIMGLNIEDGGTYKQDSMDVQLSVNDNIQMGDKITIKVDGQEVQPTVDGDVYTFLVNKSSKSQNITMEAYDVANNMASYSVNITVNPNSGVNVILIVVIAAAVLVTVGGITAVAVRGKKNKTEK